MANPQKGEIDFELGGKTYTYLLGTYGLAKLEQRMGKSWPAIMRDVQKDGPSAELTLALWHCGLLLHHEPITEKQASLLLDELRMPVFWERFAEASPRVFGTAEAATENPTTPAAAKPNGIGIPSSING
jgi:hypothetical protein